MDKQATVYLMDCNPAMAESHYGGDKTDLEWATNYVIDGLANRVLYNRKSDKAGVIMMRDDGPQNVVPLETPTRELIGKVRLDVSVAAVESSLERAILYSLAQIQDFCRKLKYKKQLIVLTNRLPYNSTELAEITSISAANNIQILIAVVDPPGNLEVPGLPDAEIVDFQELVDSIYAAKPKAVRPVALYKGLLTLGHSGATQLALDVHVYPATRKAAPPTAHRVYGIQHEPVKIAQDAIAGGIPRPKTSLETGYLYGSEIVTFSEDDKQLHFRGFSRDPCLEIIGFLNELPPGVPLGPSNYVLPAFDEAAVGLSALARALHERKQVAIVRFVKRIDTDLELCVLEPFIVDQTEGFMMSSLPFSEDFSPLQFKSLDSDERQPSDAMDNLMNEVVNDMDVDIDFQDYANPLSLRITNYIKQKAVGDEVNLDVPLPSSSTSDKLSALETALDIKKIDRTPAAEKQDTFLATEGPLDLDDLLG